MPSLDNDVSRLNLESVHTAIDILKKYDNFKRNLNSDLKVPDFIINADDYHYEITLKDIIAGENDVKLSDLGVRLTDIGNNYKEVILKYIIDNDLRCLACKNNKDIWKSNDIPWKISHPGEDVFIDLD